MANTEMSKGKKILSVFGIIILIACLAIYFAYGYIKLFCSERFEHYAFYVGTLTPESGEKEYAIKINYHKNTKNNGLECFDISISNFFDTNKKSIETQGIQYVANSPEDKIEWFDYEYLFNQHNNAGEWFIDKYPESITMEVLNSQRKFLWKGQSRAYYFSPFVNEETTSRYEYQSTDGTTYVGSTNPINKESYLLLETSTDLIGVQFKYDGYVEWLNGEPSSTGVDKLGYYESKSAFHNNKDYFYDNFSVDYFAYELYNMVQGLEAGTKGTFVIPLENMFNYYEVDANKQISDEMMLTDTDLVKKDISNYYTMYIEVSADGVSSADNSMFGLVYKTPDFKLDGATGENGNYFTGRQIIDLDHRHFDKVLLSGSDYAFKLKEDVLNAYITHKNKISLRITIDQNVLSQEGINFVGFTSDSGLENFKLEETIIIPITTGVAT